MMEEIAGVPVPQSNCVNCGRTLGTDTRFCPGCGRRVVAPPEARAPQRDLDRFFWAAGLILAYILGSHLVDSWADYRKILVFDAGFLVLVLGIVLVLRRDLDGALVPRTGRIRSGLTYLILQLALTWLVFRSLPLITHWFHLMELDYSYAFRPSSHPLGYALLSTAVFPALTEELAFRGILFGQLQRLSGTTSAIIVTGLLFAFVHFAFLSLYWLLPCGLLYGWIHAREGHIWWGVGLHMLHNGLVVLSEFGIV